VNQAKQSAQEGAGSITCNRQSSHPLASKKPESSRSFAFARFAGRGQISTARTQMLQCPIGE
jgi:hypothetical protein